MTAGAGLPNAERFSEEFLDRAIMSNPWDRGREKDSGKLHAHAALLPGGTSSARSCGGSFAGALLTATMFPDLGRGKLIYDSLLGNDYNLALVGLLFATLLTLLANLAADVCYAWLDPRISYSREDPP